MIPTRNADALTIAANAIPELRKGGAQTPLSMPPLSAELVSTFLAEVGGADAKRYATDDGRTYAVRVEGSGDRVRLTFVLADPEPRAAPAPTPASPPAPARAVALVEGTTPLTSNLDELLAEATARDASDLILSSGRNAWVRVAGAMRELPNTALSEPRLLAALGVDASDLADTGSVDFAIVRGRRYRVNVYRQSRGVAAALRPIRTDPPTLADLNLPHALHDLVGFGSGLVLVCGTAGSGKSTTLAALIEHLNHTDTRHVITLEDPIEYQYRSERCLIHQREIGDQVADFATGLRAALRESPDVILVGELRDRETVAAAITAAETGHLVLATIHASNAMVAIDRVIDVFDAGQQRQIRYQLSSTLRATLTQYLLPSPLPPGRAPAVELMRVTDAIASHVRDDKSHHIPSAIQTGRATGMIPLELSLARLVRAGRIDRSDAEATAKELRFFRELLASAQSLRG